MSLPTQLDDIITALLDAKISLSRFECDGVKSESSSSSQHDSINKIIVIYVPQIFIECFMNFIFLITLCKFYSKYIIMTLLFFIIESVVITFTLSKESKPFNP